MKVAIDGPAGSGKSTIAHELAKRCGLVLLDTGAMYRSVTLACHERKIDVTDDEAVAKVAQEISISFGTADDGTQTVALDGRDVTAEIRTPAIDADVSAVSAVPAVREAMVAQQRELGNAGDVVAEGRDIGTVVFPDAEVKVFLTANPEARAHRRALQRDIVDPKQEEAILADLKRRDKADSTRDVAPLCAAEDAVHIDSSTMTIEEEVAQISALIDEARAAADAPAEDNAPAVATEASGKPKKAAKSEDKPADPNEKFYEGAVREYGLGSRALLAASIGLCGLLSKTLWHWKFENGRTLWDAEGGQMVIMNHVSMIDPVIIVASDWAHGRRMRVLYKSEFDKYKIVNWFFARIGAIPVKRGTADIKAVRRAQRALQRGEDVLVFPEGTRIYSDDQEVEIHGGFALIAQLAKAPVIPVAIVGARDGAPGGNKPLRPGFIWMRAGDPITFDELGVKGRKKQASAMEKVAMERVYALRDALRKEHPGKM
ncbi:MAG: (d)CMP kinase [Atopobiaceae bacterium]|nr:(d)CMP kinase [Atopobiaceae bacterium]